MDNKHEKNFTGVVESDKTPEQLGKEIAETVIKLGNDIHIYTKYPLSIQI